MCREVYWIKNEQGGGSALDSDVGFASACSTAQLPLRATFIGGDLDAASAFALWALRWAQHLGAREDKGRFPASRPVVELFVYCPEESVELAYAVAYLCECVWADHGFAGMAHVATDRIDALRDSRVIIDSSSAPSHPKSGFNLEAYRSPSRMDAMMFAPQADLYFIDEGKDPWIALPRFD